MTMIIGIEKDLEEIAIVDNKTDKIYFVYILLIYFII